MLNKQQLDEISRNAAETRQLAEQLCALTTNDNNDSMYLDTEQNESQGNKQQQLDELEHIGHEAAEIEQVAKDLSGITDLYNNRVFEDKETVVRIDYHVEEAKNEMIEGNKDLDQTEKSRCSID